MNTTTAAKSSRQITTALVAKLKAENSDLQFYPTTPEILKVIKDDIGEDEYQSVLDVGAGDGRSLMYLTKGKRYGIEKCTTLIQAMDRSIYIVGTDFDQQTLIDKKIDICFSNPIYSQFAAWSEKLIRECNCSTLYLVIPSRWSDNAVIAEALKKRRAKTEILGSFDFLEADRRARAKVDIVKVNLCYEGRYSHSSPKVDAFDLWFEDNFNLEINNRSQSKYDWEQRAKEKQQSDLENALVDGRDIISVLETLYQNELSHLMKNYKAIEALDPDVLKELDVNVEGLKEAVKIKVEGLKDRYWKELFNNLDTITDKLSIVSRTKMLDQLTRHTHVDFSISNAKAVLVWVLKNANVYFDDQLVELVERMTDQNSIVMYKSNQRVFSAQDWKYRNKPDDLNRYSLDFRIVMHRVGGLSRSSSDWERSRYNGLEQCAMELIEDVITIANNLYFSTAHCSGPRDVQWESNKAHIFNYYDPIKGQYIELLQCRAFLNGNVHLKLNQDFIRRLNVEHGRLKGWLNSAFEAAEELDIDIADAESSFGSNAQITGGNLLSLTFF